MGQKGPLVSNRQAFRDYKIEKTFEAGLQLFGNEVKSLRAGNANLKGSFAKVEGEQIFVHNLHISPYEFSREESDPLRPRKLLLHKREILYLSAKIDQRGYTLVPLKIYFHRGYAKVELGLGRGKKLYDKRASLKKKQARREVDRELHRRR